MFKGKSKNKLSECGLHCWDEQTLKFMYILAYQRIKTGFSLVPRYIEQYRIVQFLAKECAQPATRMYAEHHLLALVCTKSLMGYSQDDFSRLMPITVLCTNLLNKALNGKGIKRGRIENGQNIWSRKPTTTLRHNLCGTL